MNKASTSKRSASTRSFGPRPNPTLPVKSSRCRTRSSPRSCAAQPDRFVGLASVALQQPDLAAEQLQHAVKELGPRGALVGGSVNGEELSDPKFHPFWAKAEEARRADFYPPTRYRRTQHIGSAQRERRAGECDRQLARDDDRAVAPDFRGNAGYLSRAQDLRCSRRRISAPPMPPARIKAA